MLLDLLVGGENLVAARITIHLLYDPVLLVDIHIPIVNATNLQSLKVSFSEVLPLIVHKTTDVESR